MSRCWWAVVGTVVLGCGGTSLPSDRPSQEGIIVEQGRRLPTTEGRPTIWVKDDLEDECGTIYALGEGTTLAFRNANGGSGDAELEDLEVGAAVRVWADVERPSCPGQAVARAVEVRERP
jgi:hypothetical protein